MSKRSGFTDLDEELDKLGYGDTFGETLIADAKRRQANSQTERSVEAVKRLADFNSKNPELRARAKRDWWNRKKEEVNERRRKRKKQPTDEDE